jgi:tetratricopeptide (TPR) repeat protein
VALRGPGDGASPWAVPASDVGFRTLFGSGVRTAKWFPLWFAGEYGLAVADRGDAATAEPYLVRALASRHVSDSSKWRLEFALAKVQQQLGRRGWRERYRRMLRRLKREHLAPAVRYDMATMCLQVGDLDRARRYYTSVVRSRTWRGKALFDLAALASRQNDSEACRAYLRRYTNEYPMQAHGASYHVGSMYQRLGEFGRARRYFKRARINPALSGGASFHLGEMAYLDGDWASAETHLASCLQLIPDHAKAAAYLASIAEQRRRCA